MATSSPASTAAKLRLGSFVDRLAAARGEGGTTCISVFVRAGHPAHLDRMRKTIRDEISVSAQIKSRQTRGAVQASLRALQAHLVQVGARLPPHGLALFACADAAQVAAGVHEAPLREPLRRTRYWCDSAFDLEPLRAQLADGAKLYGFAVVSGTGAMLAEVSGARQRVVASWGERIPPKQSNGGQSAARFSRSRI